MLFAEVIINIEAPLESTFDYHVPEDLVGLLQVGQLVEVEFGQRLAQGIVSAFSETAAVEETKPIIGLIDPQPVVRSWQIQLAQWLSEHYLAPVNGCLRLMLPPGLTRWADNTFDLNPSWDGGGVLTETQQRLVQLLRERGFLRGRQIKMLLSKVAWKNAANQLVRRKILRRGSVLDAPRMKPRQIRTVELIAGTNQILAKALELGRANKLATLLWFLATCGDPLPPKEWALSSSGTTEIEVKKLVAQGMIREMPAQTLLTTTIRPVQAPSAIRSLLRRLPLPLAEVQEMLPQLAAYTRVIEQPPSLSLTVPLKELPDHIFRLRHAESYYKILVYLAKKGQAVSVNELYAETDSTLSYLRRLADLDLIRLREEEVWRDPLADKDFVPAEPPILTEDQARVWGRIKIALLNAGTTEVDPEESEIEQQPIYPSNQPILLYGVTGSGKTEIYMRAIDFVLQQGQKAIVLVPEIALTPQTVRRFASRFPGRVAVLHSRLSDGERFDTWRRARQGLFDIVIGARSALFTPLEPLGIIILDEEHDASYKQTPPVPPPYYHARETAIALGQITGAMVVLGSATPDVITYHRARAGTYQLLELPHRIMGHRQRISDQAARLQLISRYQQSLTDPNDALTIPLPPVQLIDLRQELRSGNRSIFSRQLHQAIDETLSRHEQAILFLNRRGTATFIICRDCGFVLNCPNCDLPLTYHQPQLLLICHQCGRKEQLPQTCPRCQSGRIRYFGLGTEELEERVRQEWPQARIVRWDRDTTAGKDTHETLLASFINHEADILIGTQMIAKGLDLPLVTLVGVISADLSLGLPDYHTGEHTFQLLTQVAGRAGRGLLGGQVILQTYQPDHYAIQAAADHDFVSFYLDEIRFRTQHSLPPFRRLARLVLSDPNTNRAKKEADILSQLLRQEAQNQALTATDILGPTPPFFSRLEGKYRWQIIIRAPDPTRLLKAIKISPPWVIDIDPVSTL